jgi:hypothetical protein
MATTTDRNSTTPTQLPLSHREDIECAHDRRNRYFFRRPYRNGDGFHIGQRCLRCGAASRRWVPRSLFRNPESLPLAGEALQPNAHLLLSNAAEVQW